MPKYSVGVSFERVIWVEVEAKHVQAAAEKALNEVASPGLCHQCTGEAEQSDDPVMVYVVNSKGKQVEVKP